MSDLQDLFGGLDAAIYATVHEYTDQKSGRRGAAALAPLVNMRSGVLSNKANPENDHELTLCESVPIQLVSRDFRILYSYSQLLGHVAYALPAADDVGDVELLNTYCELHARVGTLARHIRDVLSDGRVTRDELPKLRAAFDDLARAGLGVVSRIEALAQ